MKDIDGIDGAEHWNEVPDEGDDDNLSRPRPESVAVSNEQTVLLLLLGLGWEGEKTVIGFHDFEAGQKKERERSQQCQDHRDRYEDKRKRVLLHVENHRFLHVA